LSQAWTEDDYDNEGREYDHKEWGWIPPWDPKLNCLGHDRYLKAQAFIAAHVKDEE
jgi:hypothetical protein